MKKTVLPVLLAFLMLPAASMAQRIFVRLAPPVPIVEHYGPPPHHGWVWVGGYQRWTGAGYVWAPGYWARPPRPYAVWVPAHWAPRPRGWVFIRGHWR